MSEDNKELRDLIHQVEAQLFATQAAIRSILAAAPELVPTVAQELERVRAATPGRVVTDSVFAAMDRAIRRMLPAEPPEPVASESVGNIQV
jgi:hypothetical protein